MKIESVLLIDDAMEEHYLASYTIKKFCSEIEILSAYDGEQALGLLDTLEKEPSLILLDINMPGMNGFSFLEECKKLSSPLMNIAMLTSSEQDSDRERALEYETVKEYIIKPIGVKDLERIAGLLK